MKTWADRHEVMITNHSRGAYAHCSCGWKAPERDGKAATVAWARHLANEAKS